MALVTINGQAITDPASVKLGKFNLTKAGRTASGRMAMEIIARKRSLSLEWDKIPEADLRTVLDLLDTRTFHTVVYPDPQGPGGQGTITAYVGDISQGLWHRVGGVRYWTDVKIGLVEQ